MLFNHSSRILRCAIWQICADGDQQHGDSRLFVRQTARHTENGLCNEHSLHMHNTSVPTSTFAGHSRPAAELRATVTPASHFAAQSVANVIQAFLVSSRSFC